MIIRASHSVESRLAVIARWLIVMQYDVTHAYSGLESRGGTVSHAGETSGHPRGDGPPPLSLGTTRVTTSLSLAPCISRRASHRRLRHGGSGAKFPANPTNLSQPNIGRWWILIPLGGPPRTYAQISRAIYPTSSRFSPTLWEERETLLSFFFHSPGKYLRTEDTRGSITERLEIILERSFLWKTSWYLK